MTSPQATANPLTLAIFDKLLKGKVQVSELKAKCDLYQMQVDSLNASARDKSESAAMRLMSVRAASLAQALKDDTMRAIELFRVLG